MREEWPKNGDTDSVLSKLEDNASLQTSRTKPLSSPSADVASFNNSNFSKSVSLLVLELLPEDKVEPLELSEDLAEPQEPTPDKDPEESSHCPAANVSPLEPQFQEAPCLLAMEIKLPLKNGT